MTFDRGMATVAGGRKLVVCRRRALSVVAPIATTSLLLTFAASSAPAAPRPAMPRRKMALASTLHASLVTSRIPAPGAALAPRVPPLRVRNPKTYAAAKAAAEGSYLARRRRRASAAPGTPQSSSTTATPFTPSSQAAIFEGLNSAGMEAGGLFTEDTPPDTTGSIGPNNYVELVNSQIGVYNRALGLLATEGEDEFSGGESTCDGQIRWDQQGGRWEYASLNCAAPSTEQSFNFGWSKTADPTNLASGWCKYTVRTEKFLVDYPKLGGDNDFLIVGANEFDMAKEEEYVGSSVIVAPKPAPGVATCPSNFGLSLFRVPVFTPVPANIYGSSTTGYVVAAEPPNGVVLATVKKSPEGKPEMEGSTLPVSGFSLPAPVPQPGTTDGIDSSDTRLTQAVAAEDPTRHEMAVWTQHTVATAPGEPSVVRWYELTAGSPVPIQEGDIAAPGGAFAFNGAISPTSAGNGAVIDYNVGGEAMTAQLRAQSRGSTTPPGAMHGEVTLVESEAIDQDFSCPSAGLFPSTSCRWGDYAGASPDPANLGVVWGGGQVNGRLPATEFGAQWRTENFALAVHAPPSPSFSVTSSTPTAATPTGFDGSASSDPEGTIASYQWSFGDGTSATGEQPAHTYAQPGLYQVKLTVTDDAGFTASTERSVAVADAPPLASFAVNTATPTAAAPVSFDGSASSDPDGTISSYEWSFGDGSTAAGGPVATHTYIAAGTYTVTLTVTDNGSLAASVSHLVTVATAPFSPMVTGNGGLGVASEQTASTERAVTVVQPSNRVRITAIKQNRKTGSVTLRVLVPGSGSLSVRDARAPTKVGRHGARVVKALVKPVNSTIPQAETVTLQIVPTAAARTALSRKHKLSVKALVSFTPTNGALGTTVQALTLVISTGNRQR
jgi:PKD repeat protein